MHPSGHKNPEGQLGRSGEPSKVREFQHFIQNSGKVRKFGNFKA